MKCYCGIPEIKFVWHGEWSDPELIYKNHSFNYYDLENPLWEDYRVECAACGVNADDVVHAFPEWVKENKYTAFEYLDNLLECKCFYGGNTE